MNVLITGANGFIGKALTKKMIDLGFNVYAIVTSKQEIIDLKSDRLHIFELFFNEYNLISSLIKCDIDIVYHLAWKGLCGSDAKRVDVQIENILATSILLEEIKKINAKKLVFASTMNTLEVRGLMLKPTEYSTRGVHVHVAAKINAEIVSRVFCNDNSIQYNEAIIAMAYGENNKSKMVTNIFIYSLLNNIPPKMVDGKNQYDIIYIEDIVDGLIAIGEKGVNKKSYYLGHSWNKTFRDIFTEIKDILCPNASIEFGAYPDDNSIDFTLINRNELFNDTGWEPKFDFKQSILNTANWIKKSGFSL